MQALKHLERIQVSHPVMLRLLHLYEQKGTSYFYDQILKKDQASFEKNAIEDNMACLFKYFGLELTDARLQSMIKKDLSPKNKTEQRMLNIKKAITLIHESEHFDLVSNEFADLAKLLSNQLDKNNFETTIIEGEALLNQKKISHREHLESLIELTNRLIKKQSFPLPHLFANFYVDFMNLRIFKFDNDLIGLLILYMLLLQHFKALKYVSFFKHFLAYKEAFKQAEVAASYYWKSGYAQTEFLTQIILDVLKLCYDDIETIAHTYQFEVKLNKTDSIENTILKLPEIFKKEDIRQKHPTVSDATIDRTLARLRDEGMIRPLGKGRTTKWQLLVEKTVYTTMKQLSLFGDEL
jgi:hypothetical protein